MCYSRELSRNANQAVHGDHGSKLEANENIKDICRAPSKDQAQIVKRYLDVGDGIGCCDVDDVSDYPDCGSDQSQDDDRGSLDSTSAWGDTSDTFNHDTDCLVQELHPTGSDESIEIVNVKTSKPLDVAHTESSDQTEQYLLNRTFQISSSAISDQTEAVLENIRLDETVMPNNSGLVQQTGRDNQRNPVKKGTSMLMDNEVRQGSPFTAREAWSTEFQTRGLTKNNIFVRGEYIFWLETGPNVLWLRSTRISSLFESVAHLEIFLCSPENVTCSPENFTCSPENFTFSPQNFTSSPVKCRYLPE